MKPITTLFALLFAILVLSAQSPGQNHRSTEKAHFKNTEEVSDFTVVDSDGVEWNLYTLLEGGTTVVLDLFQST